MGMPDLTKIPLPVYADLPTVPREEWGGVPPKDTGEDEKLKVPAEFLILNHSDTEPCTTKEDCSKLMRDLQKKHMDELGMSDIQHNYVVGGDGNIYEGRHWDRRSPENPKCPEVFDKNIDLVVVGKYEENPVPYEISTPAYDLVRVLVRKGDLIEDFTFKRLIRFKHQEVKRDFSFPEEV